MKVTVKGDKLTIEMDLDEKGRVSSSGKTMIHATSGGNQSTIAQCDGKPLIVGVNAYTKNADYVAPPKA